MAMFDNRRNQSPIYVELFTLYREIFVYKMELEYRIWLRKEGIIIKCMFYKYCLLWENSVGCILGRQPLREPCLFKPDKNNIRLIGEGVLYTERIKKNRFSRCMLYRHNAAIGTDWNLFFWDNSLYQSSRNVDRAGNWEGEMKKSKNAEIEKSKEEMEKSKLEIEKWKV